MAMQIGRREKKSLYILAGFLIIYSVFNFIIFPIVDNRAKASEKLIQRKSDLIDITELYSEYKSLEDQAKLSSQLIKKRDRNFTLFSFLDGLAGKANIKENISYMKPSVSEQKDTNLKLSIVEMKVQGISLEQFTNFLYHVETSEKSVYVKRLSINKDKKEGTITTVMQVETVMN